MTQKCPQCSSTRKYKDGLRVLANGESVQRFICRDCGFRFSERQNSNKQPGTIPNRQLCAILQEAKKLDSATETKTVAGETPRKEQGTKGRFVKFLSLLENEGVKENSAKIYVYYLQNIIDRNGNLDNPESIKAVIAKKNWSLKSKALAVSAYSKYLDVMGGTWKKPKYKPERKIPFLPTEEELNCLINAAHKRLATYLSILKATGMRSTEAWMLKREDIDMENNIITLNDTLKHGTPRQFRVKPQVLAMINVLNRRSDAYIFHDPEKPCGLINFAKAFRSFRKRLAFKMHNPRLNKISFHSFRHWFGTMEYHNTKDIIYVKERLGHKSINTTLLYTQLINFDSEQCYSAVAKTKEEAQKLIDQGFRFECDIEGVKLFRKPK